MISDEFNAQKNHNSFHKNILIAFITMRFRIYLFTLAFPKKTQ